MNKFFKNDMLTLDIKVHGETDDYYVKITFGHILEDIQREVEKNNDDLQLKCILRSLIRAFNNDNVYVSCSCPDWIYRFSYYATRNDISSAAPENRPSNITNPNDTKGSGCKHILLVLANTSWMMKLAICIKNYVDYVEKHYTKQYADIIFPKIYGRKYEDDVQLDLFDEPEVQETDDEVISKANDEKQQSTRFQKGNTKGVRFAPTGTPKDEQQQIDDEIDIEDAL